MGWKEGGIVQSGQICCKKGIGFWCHKHREELLCFTLRRKASMVHPTWFTRLISQCMQWSCDNNRFFAPTLNMAPRISIVRGSGNPSSSMKIQESGAEAVFHAFNVLLKAEILNSPRGNRGGVRGVACQQNSSNLPITKINRPRRGDAIRTTWFDMWCATTLSLSVPSHCVEPVTQHVLHFDMFDQSRDREVE